MDWEKKSIDLGCNDWRFKDSNYRYISEEAAEKDKERRQHKGKPFHTDTRKTIREVLMEIKALEAPYLECPDDDSSIGPWDEYASPSSCRDMDWKVEDTDFEVCPVFGGSEGIYLHVNELTRNGPRGLILMKTCGMGPEKWKACWESAMRIAWYLSWHVN